MTTDPLQPLFDMVQTPDRGRVVWHAHCTLCGWTDTGAVADLEQAKDNAVAHLQAEHVRPETWLGRLGETIRVPPTLGPDFQAGQCMCLWREDLPCPNRATWRVENTTNAGFSEMCTPHKEGFAILEPTALVRYVRLEEA